MIVYKFGGATTRTARGLQSLVEVIEEGYTTEYRVKGRRAKTRTPGVAVVVSAIGHSTRSLSRAAELAAQGKLRLSEEQLDRVTGQHEQLLSSLDLSDDTKTLVHREFHLVHHSLRALIEGIFITRELSARTRDNVVSHGELFSLPLVYHLLVERGLEVRRIDARDMIVTNEDFGRAAPLIEETLERASKRTHAALQKKEIILTQGFIGATRDKITTTMGSESSDLTASLLARALEAHELVIWKTVPGIFTADPELVPSAKLLKELTYSEAEEIGRRGARVLYATALEPLREASTAVRVAAPLSRTKRWTSVTAGATKTVRKPQPIGIAVEHALRIFTLNLVELRERQQRDPRRWARQGIEEQIRRHAVLEWQSEQEQTIIVRDSAVQPLTQSLAHFELALEPRDRCGLVSTILRTPENFRFDASSFEEVLRALRPFRVFGYFPVEKSLVAIVHPDDTLPALRKLHRGLFGV